MNRTRIRWRKVGRLAAVAGAAVLAVFVLPDLLSPPDQPPLPADVGLATGATGAYAYVAASDDARRVAGPKRSHAGRHRPRPEPHRPDPRRRLQRPSPEPAPPADPASPPPTPAPEASTAPPPPVPVAATPAPPPPAPGASAPPADDSSSGDPSPPAAADQPHPETPHQPSQFGFEH